MIDLDGTHREIGSRRIAAGDARTILMRRWYGAAIGEVWHCCTDPERLSRWFVRPTGDLRVGGRFVLEGNAAAGEVRHCEPPRLLAASWVYGSRPADEVELRLAPQAGGTVLELEHASVTTHIEVGGRMVDVLLNDPNSGLWGLGAGWEMGLVALDALLRNALPERATRRGAGGVMSLADQSSQAWAELIGPR